MTPPMIDRIAASGRMTERIGWPGAAVFQVRYPAVWPSSVTKGSEAVRGPSPSSGVSRRSEMRSELPTCSSTSGVILTMLTRRYGRSMTSDMSTFGPIVIAVTIEGSSSTITTALNQLAVVRTPPSF